MSEVEHPHYDPVFDRVHTCHNPLCDNTCAPKMLACKVCWYRLPLPLRSRIWRTYKTGQEETKRVTPEYIEAFKACVDWWNSNPTKLQQQKIKV